MKDTTWWDGAENPHERADCLKSVCSRLKTDQAWRRDDALRRYSTYFGRELASLADLELGGLWVRDTSTTTNLPDEQLSFARAAVNTVVARIAGRERPRPVILTQGADYKTRVQARLRSKFLEGQYQEPQGMYPSTYALGTQAFFDAALTDSVVRTTPDLALKKVRKDRIPPWNVYFDEEDARNGNPTQLYVYDPQAKSVLKAKYKAFALDIDRQEFCSDPELKRGPHDARCVDVWDCYVKAHGETKGRHVVLMGDVMLLDEEWEYDFFPYNFLFWHDSPVGVRGLPPIEFAKQPQDRANYFLDRITENTMLLAGGYVLAEQDVTKEGALEANDALKIIEYTPGRQPPQVVMPQPFHPSVLQIVEWYKQQVFEVFGVNQLTVNGQVDPSTTSGIAVRNKTDLQDMQFLPQLRKLEQWYVDDGKLTIWAMNHLAKNNVQPAAMFPSDGFLQKITWSAIELGEKSLYTVQVRTASDNADTYSARLQFIQELKQSGDIDADTATRLTLSGDPDLENYSKRRYGQWNWIERIIYEIHDAKDTGDIDVEGFDELMDPVSAAMQMTDAYLECSSWGNTPENKRKAMRRWIQQCIDFLNKTKAPPAPPPGAGLAAGGPAGAPPLPPMTPPGPSTAPMM